MHDTTQDMAILVTMSLELRVDRQCQSSCDEEDGCQVNREDFDLHDQTFCGTDLGNTVGPRVLRVVVSRVTWALKE